MRCFLSSAGHDNESDEVHDSDHDDGSDEYCEGRRHVQFRLGVSLSL